MLEEPLDLAPWFHCGTCNATLATMGEDGFFRHLEGDESNCPKCSTKVDLWTVMASAVRNNFMMTGVYVAIGANTKLFSFKLGNNEHREILFEDFGIPEDARVLFQLLHTVRGRLLSG